MSELSTSLDGSQVMGASSAWGAYNCSSFAKQHLDSSYMAPAGGEVQCSVPLFAPCILQTISVFRAEKLEQCHRKAVLSSVVNPGKSYS